MLVETFRSGVFWKLSYFPFPKRICYLTQLVILYSIYRHRNCFNRPQRSCSKVMFLHLSVILFTRGLGRHPPSQTIPWADTPLDNYPSLADIPLCSACWDGVNQGAVGILLECNLVFYFAQSLSALKFIVIGYCQFFRLVKVASPRCNAFQNDT